MCQAPFFPLGYSIEKKKKKKDKALPYRTYINKEAKTINKVISDCGKRSKNYDGGDMRNLDLGRHLL